MIPQHAVKVGNVQRDYKSRAFGENSMTIPLGFNNLIPKFLRFHDCHWILHGLHRLYFL